MTWTYALRPNPGAKPTGRLASRPIKNDEREEMAAVAVMRSRFTSLTHARYVVSSMQPSEVGHMQVSPESERLEAFTAI